MKKGIIIFVILTMLTACSSVGNIFARWKAEKEAPYFSAEDFKSTEAIKEPWYDNYRVIAHALGGIDEYDYTNSYEALTNNYNLGTRVFEIDLGITSDGTIVLIHEWNQYHEEFELGVHSGWSEEDLSTFKENKIFGKYTTMTFVELLYIMSAIPDFYIVIDSKTFEEENTRTFYEKIIKTVEKVDADLFARLIPQAYSPDVYRTIKNTEKFNDIILTLYHYYATSDGYKIYNFVKEEKIKNVVLHMNDHWAEKVIRDIRDYALYDEEWNYENINIYIHTINDKIIAKEIVEIENFYGIYSDFISENEFIKLLSE